MFFFGFGTIWDNSLSFCDNLGQFFRFWDNLGHVFRFWDNLGHVFRVWDNLGHFFRSLFGGSEKVQGCRAPAIMIRKGFGFMAGWSSSGSLSSSPRGLRLSGAFKGSMPLSGFGACGLGSWV